MSRPAALEVIAVQFRIRPVSSFEEFAGDVHEALEAAVGAASGRAPRLVVLPQLFTMGLFAASPGWERDDLSQLSRIAEHLPAVLELCAAEARAHGIWLLAGSTLSPSPGGPGGSPSEEVQNVAHLFGPAGQHHSHAKTHAFAAERTWSTVEGAGLEVIDVEGVSVGIAICYESTSPEVATILSRKGAEVILIPSYNHSPDAFHRVRHCAAAHAVQNLVFTVHCPAGGEVPGLFPAAQGRPAILGPCGEGFPADGILAEGEPGRTDSVIAAVLDVGMLRERRSPGGTGIYHDRRTHAQLYSACGL